MASALIWKGDELIRKLERAVPDAIDATTQEAADHAKGSHWWGSRHGRLQAEIVNEGVKRTGALRWSGKFGSTQHRGFYGLILEYRNPFLRPAADATFKHLALRLKATFR